MTRCSGLCLPYCCAGSRPISDSDISDFDVDDGIGVVPPGAWMNKHGPAFFFFFACLDFYFFIIFWNIEDTGFRERIVGKNSFPDYSIVPVPYLVNEKFLLFIHLYLFCISLFIWGPLVCSN